MPLKKLSIPPIELLPLFDDEKTSSEGPSTCRPGHSRSQEELVCAVIYSHYGKIELQETPGVRQEEESLTVTLLADTLQQMNEALGKNAG